jgi:hypothetical protein
MQQMDTSQGIGAESLAGYFNMPVVIDSGTKRVIFLKCVTGDEK